MPTIVISGEQDQVDPPAVLKRELLPRIPQATLSLLPGIGHLSPLEAPNAVAELIRTFVLSAGEVSAPPPAAAPGARAGLETSA